MSASVWILKDRQADSCPYRKANGLWTDSLALAERFEFKDHAVFELAKVLAERPKLYDSLSIVRLKSRGK